MKCTAATKVFIHLYIEYLKTSDPLLESSSNFVLFFMPHLKDKL